MIRARELLTNGVLAATTLVEFVREDPLRTAVQLSRRLPVRVRSVLARALLLGGPAGRTRAGGTRAAYAAWLLGRDDVAGRALETAVADGARPRRRLLAELALQLQRPDLAQALLPRPPVAFAARSAWLLGDLGRAGALLRAGDAPHALLARYGSYRSMLQPGRRLRAPDGPPARAAGSGPAVFHVLNNSLPHTWTGYTLRSDAVLDAQVAAGVRVGAATRIGYPVSVGVLTARHRDRVGAVLYERVIPAVLSQTLNGRLQQQADRLQPTLRRFAPTVLHTTTDVTNALVTEALARANGLPWVYEVRGLLEETWVASQRGAAAQDRAAASERYTLLRAKEAELACAADHVVTLSRTLADELVARGVDRGAMSVVPNSVDPSLLLSDTSAESAREALGLPRAGFWVGTVSSLVDYEGIDTLVAAVAELRRGGLDARLCVVGDGVARAGLQQRAEAAGLGGHAVFPGRVPRVRAVGYHRALDVFALPRRDLRVCRYVSPLKPVEAMACGRPVVASDLPVLAELVRDPGSGLLTEPGDASGLAAALASLAGDRERMAALGAAGKAFAATRTWAQAGLAYRALYERLAAESGGPTT